MYFRHDGCCVLHEILPSKCIQCTGVADLAKFGWVQNALVKVEAMFDCQATSAKVYALEMW